MNWLRSVLLLVGLAFAATAADSGWHQIWRETFDDWPLGKVAPTSHGWQAFPDGKNRIEVMATEKGRAVRLLDVTHAPKNASCRLSHALPPEPGEYRISYRTMLRQGDAGKLSQDMGLHLFDSSVLLDVFFSGDQLKTWQDGWTSLAPPVLLEKDHWYHIEIVVRPTDGTATLTVDGVPRQPVALRRIGEALTRLEFTCQRYATGELWIDDVRVDHRAPAELCSKPSERWRTASEEEKRQSWFPDEGSETSWGRLRSAADGVAVARRIIAADFTGNPTLALPLKRAQGTQVRVYLRRLNGDGICLLSPSESGRYALFAETGWDGPVEAELMVAVVGKGSVKLAKPSIETRRVVDYRDVQAVARFVDPSHTRNRFEGALALTVRGIPGRDRPVHFGVPFPAGMLSRTNHLALRQENGDFLPLQTRPLSFWPDGTVRWLLVDSVVSLPAAGSIRAALCDESPPRSPPAVASVADGEIRLATGELSCRIRQEGFAPFAGLPAPCDGTWDFLVQADGTTYRASQGVASARLEDNGPVRATVVISGTLTAGDDAPFQYELRLSLIRGTRDLLISPTFLLSGTAPERQLEDVRFILGAKLAPGTVSFGADQRVILSRKASQEARICQDQYNHYSVALGSESMGEGDASSGWVQTGSVTFAVRRFREQFRKALAVTDTELRAELWAPGASRRFGRGAAKTHDLVLAFGMENPQDAARLTESLDQPAIPDPGPAWLARSQALGKFPLPSPDTRELDAIYEAACDRRLTERDRRPDRSFGMVDYGETNHINSEIDAAVALYLQWARTGNRKWLDAALDWSQHSQDIDVCHASPNAREIGIHHSHYPSDHNNGGLTLTHTWVRGQLFRYYLLGDERSLIAADLAGRAYDRNSTEAGQLFDGGKRNAGIGSRAYGRGCWALSELYKATLNPAYLATMKKLTAYLGANLRPDGAVPASHNGAGVWSTTDECPHMAAICAVGLARYASLLPKRDRRPLITTLTRIANWQLSRGSMPQKVGIMYHNYPGGEVIHFVDACADMLEAWIALYGETRKPLYRDMAESVYDNMIEMGSQWRHDWTMGARNVLFYVAERRDLPEPIQENFSPAPADAEARFLASCQNADGGFGLAPGLPSDMDSTFRALDVFRLLKTPIPRAEACLAWVLSCQDKTGGYAIEPGWYPTVAWTCLGLRALVALDCPTPHANAAKEWLVRCFNDDGGCGSGPVTGPLAYHPAWQSTTDYTSYAIQSLALLQSEPPDRVKTREFLLNRQVDRGGFNNRRGDAATWYTALALDGLRRLPALPGEREYRKGVLAWLVALRKMDNGYGSEGAVESTLRNTYHVLSALRSLQVSLSPDDAQRTRRYVRSCRTKTGGFGHRPGRTATVVDTWYGVRAAILLGPEPKGER